MMGGNNMGKMVTEFTQDSHLQGNKYFRVVHGKSDKAHSVGLHRHDFVEVFWVRNGGGMLISSGKERYFSKNFLYISRPNEVHVLEPERNSTLSFTYVAIARDVFEDFMNVVLAGEEELYRNKFAGISLKLSPFETSFLDRAAAELAWQNDSRMAIMRFLLNLSGFRTRASACAIRKICLWGSINSGKFAARICRTSTARCGAT